MMDTNDYHIMAIRATTIVFPKVLVPQKIAAGISLIMVDNSVYAGSLL